MRALRGRRWRSRASLSLAWIWSMAVSRIGFGTVTNRPSRYRPAWASAGGAERANVVRTADSSAPRARAGRRMRQIKGAGVGAAGAAMRSPHIEGKKKKDEEKRDLCNPSFPFFLRPFSFHPIIKGLEKGVKA